VDVGNQEGGRDSRSGELIRSFCGRSQIKERVIDIEHQTLLPGSGGIQGGDLNPVQPRFDLLLQRH
jgi:hypothetical protein